MNGSKMTADDKRWRAESDADAMARYEEIMADARRKKMAINVAKQRAADLSKRAGVMQRVASGGASSRKSTPNKKK